VSGLLVKTLRSTTFKLALLSIVVFGTIVLALFSYVYFSTASFLRSACDREINAERALLQQAFSIGGGKHLAEVIQQRIANQRLGGGMYLLSDPSFRSIAGNLKTWPSGFQGDSGWGEFRPSEAGTYDAKSALLRARFDTLSSGDHLLVGKEIGDLDRFADEIKTAIILTVAMIFTLAAIASVLVTQRTIGRLESINTTSRAIMHSGLGKRIPLRGTHDEWDDVAASLNLMLDRIETLMAEVKQVTDNVAHDLRTPLTRLRGRLERAYQQQRDSADDQVLIGDAIVDLDFVLRIFSSLTRISQIEATDPESAFGIVNLADVAEKIADLYDAVAEDKGAHLTLRSEQSACIMGNQDLLFDAVANLVDNAIKHGRAGGQVSVQVINSSSGAAISVADDGPGIPVSEHTNVFKRFYRLERSRHTPGNGLGLSLVKAIAHLHNARIEMVDNAPGLAVCLSFPAPIPFDIRDKSVL
jgi:signal transduction histidine kinase